MRLRKACGFSTFTTMRCWAPKAQAWRSKTPRVKMLVIALFSVWCLGFGFFFVGKEAFVDIIGAWAQQKYAATANCWQFFRCPRPGKDKENCGWAGGLAREPAYCRRATSSCPLGTTPLHGPRQYLERMGWIPIAKFSLACDIQSWTTERRRLEAERHHFHAFARRERRRGRRRRWQRGT